MKKLFRLLFALFAAVGAFATVFFLGRKNQWSCGSMWKSARKSTSSWGETAANEAGEAASTVSSAASDAADTVSDVASPATDTPRHATDS
jgi:hypothetical protein